MVVVKGVEVVVYGLEAVAKGVDVVGSCFKFPMGYINTHSNIIIRREIYFHDFLRKKSHLVFSSSTISKTFFNALLFYSEIGIQCDIGINQEKRRYQGAS